MKEQFPKFPKRVRFSEIYQLTEFLETFQGLFCTICRCFQIFERFGEYKRRSLGPRSWKADWRLSRIKILFHFLYLPYLCIAWSNILCHALLRVIFCCFFPVLQRHLRHVALHQCRSQTKRPTEAGGSCYGGFGGMPSPPRNFEL